MRARIAHVAFGIALFVAGLLPAAPAAAWEVYCAPSLGGPPCKDALEQVRVTWRADPLAEHAVLLGFSMTYAGLPLALKDPFDLDLFTTAEMVIADDGTAYPTFNPRFLGAVARKQTRTLYIVGMAMLPDMAYTIADWASGAENCLPNLANDPFDCHNYPTHIGWLNSNHFLPQSRKWYEHLHAIALDRAAACKATHDTTPLAQRDRFENYFKACEKLALVIEGVAQHYLQDAWALGHMWARWGGAEVADFGGNRALGYAISAWSGLIHGGKAMLDTNPKTALLAPWDDPLNAPHPNGQLNDAGQILPGLGDVFSPDLLASPGDVYGPVRRALFGCAADGLRAVYGATAMVHGALVAPNLGEIDLSRSVSDGTCWNQRATNRAMGTGIGIHQGAKPNQVDVTGDVHALVPLILGISQFLAKLSDEPDLEMDELSKTRFNLGAAAAAGLTLALAADPTTADGIDIASGFLPAIAGVLPNPGYARGDAATHVPPATYADPFPPWKVKESNPDIARRSVPLNLTFADANAGDRCTELGTADLDALRDAVSDARPRGQPQEEIDARCGRCAQIVAPHLRFGANSGNFDAAREAYCALAVPNASAFVYTGEPGPFTGQEPRDFASLMEAARTACHCYQVTVALAPATATMNASQTRLFAATVTGTPNTAVTWSATGGTITQAGVYTATANGTFTVKATSVADPTQFASASVSVVQPGGIVISPQKAAVGFGKSRVFSAVSGAPPFTWSATGGTITQAGVYTGGNVAGEYDVLAANASGTGAAAVVVDPYVGIYKGSWQRFVPAPALSGINKQFAIGRFFAPRAECGFGALCYGTSPVDFGTVVIGQCWFAPTFFGSPAVQGYCEETTSSGGGTLTGTVTDTSYDWTLKRTFQGTLVESWSFQLPKQP
jgi:hypothetical protein